MKVRITNCKGNKYWYNEKIGEVFEITYLPNGVNFLVSEDEGMLARRAICKTDCEIVEEPLNAAEAVYGFAAWLTTRQQETVMSDTHDSGAIAELVKQFCLANNLPEVSANWPDNLKHPKPHWRDTVSETNPVLVYLGDTEADVESKRMRFCNGYDKHTRQYRANRFWWKYAKRVPEQEIQKMLANYKVTSEEE